MKNVQKIDLGLTGYDELFANDEERKVNKLPRIFDIPISEIDDFPDHPFKVKIDEDMDQLVQSIKERGIITPVTLRPKEDGRYEIVSGHRRKKACEIAGLDTVKAEVREMSRDEAIILMVESNLQRSTILPSEKAFSYKMRLEAMKRQAGRPAQDMPPKPVLNMDMDEFRTMQTLMLMYLAIFLSSRFPLSLGFAKVIVYFLSLKKSAQKGFASSNITFCSGVNSCG